MLIAEHANSMIDVSDGLGSEIKHICNESNSGAAIYYEKIPFSARTKKSAKELDMNPHDFALYGGEDFELVFTIPEDNLESLRKEFKDFTVIGKILNKKEGIYILKNNKKLEVKKGYDHFAQKKKTFI